MTDAAAAPAGADTAPVLEVDDVARSFGDLRALNGVSLAVRPRTIHAIIGPNGAGKTTLFNILTGRLRPTRGTVRYLGRRITDVPAHRRVKLGISRSFQVTTLFQELPAEENVRLAAGGPRSRRALNFWGRVPHEPAVGEILDRVGLAHAADVRAGELSHGQQRILEVAMALAAGPRLMLLDEPTSGMGVEDVGRMESLLTDLGRDHTLVFIEHNMNLTMRVADQITVLVGGQVLTDGEPREISGSAAVQEAYLGGVT